MIIVFVNLLKLFNFYFHFPPKKTKKNHNSQFDFQIKTTNYKKRSLIGLVTQIKRSIPDLRSIKHHPLENMPGKTYITTTKKCEPKMPLNVFETFSVNCRFALN